MQKVVVKVGHPDPEQAKKLGIKTEGVVTRDLTPHEIAKREHTAAVFVAGERVKQARRDELASLKRGVTSDLAALAQDSPPVARLLRYLLLRSGHDLPA